MAGENQTVPKSSEAQRLARNQGRLILKVNFYLFIFDYNRPKVAPDNWVIKMEKKTQILPYGQPSRNSHGQYLRLLRQ